MDKRKTLHRVAVVAASVALVAAGTALVATAQGSPGCDRDVGPIAESNDFTPYEARRTQLQELPIASIGRAPTSVESGIDGMQLRWTTGDGEHSYYRYFVGQPLDQHMTVAQFRAANGIQLDRDAVDGDPYTAEDVIAQVGDRAVKVQLGDYEGALVWADPLSNGARPHHLYWSDGTYNYALMAVRGPQRMVQLGRELVCGE